MIQDESSVKRRVPDGEEERAAGVVHALGKRRAMFDMWHHVGRAPRSD